MTRCIVIGSEARANDTAQLLTTSNVPSKGIADCGKEKRLEVVAVFCNDFSKNVLRFLHGLRGSLHPRVRIHALKDGNGQTGPTSRSLYEIKVDDVFCFNNMPPVTAARSIKTRWFPSEQVQTSKLGSRS